MAQTKISMKELQPIMSGRKIVVEASLISLAVFMDLVVA